MGRAGRPTPSEPFLVGNLSTASRAEQRKRMVTLAEELYMIMDTTQADLTQLTHHTHQLPLSIYQWPNVWSYWKTYTGLSNPIWPMDLGSSEHTLKTSVFRVYCNGNHEHYIDLACPSGKTNSTLEFCPPVALFAKSVVANYSSPGTRYTPRLGSYVDDIFGGLSFSQSLAEAFRFRRYICDTGRTLSLEFNMVLNKTPPPATYQVILGNAYDSINRRVRTADKKRKKYISRIETLLKLSWARVSQILKVHGNLNFAAEVSPFGRPFLAHLTNATLKASPKDYVYVTDMMKMGLRIWRHILRANRGVTFDFVFGKTSTMLIRHIH